MEAFSLSSAACTHLLRSHYKPRHFSNQSAYCHFDTQCRHFTQLWANKNAAPTRPKHTWTAREPAWTDGRGNTEQYHAIVLQCSKFHDLLPDTNVQKIPKHSRGLVLQGQLFGRPVDLVAAIPHKILMSEDGMLALANAIHKFDPLVPTSDAYKSFLAVVTCVRKANETHTGFENRFESLMCKARKASGSSTVMPEVYCAFMLLTNARMDSSHKVSILARLPGKSLCTPILKQGASVNAPGQPSQLSASPASVGAADGGPATTTSSQQSMQQGNTSQLSGKSSYQRSQIDPYF